MAQRVQNMTEGSPMKRMLSFGLPLLFGTLFQQFYSLVDTMVVGYTLGDRAISAIGATFSVYSLLFFLTASLTVALPFPSASSSAPEIFPGCAKPWREPCC